MNLPISVVICAYTEERWDALTEAIESIYRQTLPPCENILVVDHNPALFQRAQREFRGVYVIENRFDPGLSGARNSGVEAARGEVIAFLDEDAVAPPGWLKQLADWYSDPGVLGAGGAIHPNWLAGKRPAWLPEEFDWVVGCTYRGMPEESAPVRNLIGCNMSFRKEAFSGEGFRSGMGRGRSLPMGCEETEFCIRAVRTRSGKQLIYDPQAPVFHRVPKNRVTWQYFIRRCYAEGLSKAQVTRMAGSKAGLSNERSYVRKTLLKGAWKGVTDAFQGDPAGLARSTAIMFGLACTASGYLVGKLLK